jgi:tetratricopeptide (TPR) repeat protein
MCRWFYSKIYFILIGALLAGLGGCGASSSDPPVIPAVATRLIAGAVEDGPIAGAQVSLLDAATSAPVWGCGASGQGLCSQQFDNPDGHFAFLLAQSIDPATLLVEAKGGIDQATRIDFSRTGFAATPLRLLFPLSSAAQFDQISVNPLTTLLVLASATSLTPLQVRQALAVWLGQPADFDLFAAPGSRVDNQRLALFVSMLALHAQTDDPFAGIAALIDPDKPLIDQTGNLDAAALSGLLLPEQIEDLQTLLVELTGQGNPQVMFNQLQRHEIVQGFMMVLADPASSVLSDPTLLAPTDSNLQHNLDTLSIRILLAVGNQLLLGGMVPEHLARYVLYTYALEDSSRLMVEPAVFETYLTRLDNGVVVELENDVSLAGLANLQVTQAVTVPLPTSGLAAADDLTLSDLKRDYYYRSDISHLYRAKQLVWNVDDDQLTDSVLVKVVEGEALAGRFAETETLIQTQIYQSEARGQAYLKYAEGLTSHGLAAQALMALENAENLFRRVVEAKGMASFSNDDAQNFRDLAKGYVQAGFPILAMAVLQYLADDVSGFLSTTTAYGNLTSAGMYVVDAFAELNDTGNAETALEMTYQMGLLVPNDTNGKAQYRVRVLIDVAERFADFGLFDRVWEAWDKVFQLRYADGMLTATGAATEIYMDDLAVAIYAAGGTEEAYDLIASLPATPTSKDHTEALKKLATFLALRDGLGPELEQPPVDFVNYTAMDLINFSLVPDLFNPTVEDNQIEALTYFTTSLAYVAQEMINHQRFAEAVTALLKAETLVDKLDRNGVKLKNYNAKVNYGYAKLAGLYLQLGDRTEAERMLGKGVDVLPYIDDATHYANAVTALADLYLDLGDFAAASSLLSGIGETVEADGYPRIIEAFIRISDYLTALTYIAEYADVAEASYNPQTMDNSAVGAASVSDLRKAAGYYSQLGFFPEAVATLQRALPAAWDIPTETTRMARLTDLAAGLAEARADQQAESLAWSLPFVSYRNKALLAIAEKLATRDDFPESAIATIDLDGDGLPDFFSPDASAADIALSGLVLDRDSDNDGVPDDEDRWPFFSLLPSPH